MKNFIIALGWIASNCFLISCQPPHSDAETAFFKPAGQSQSSQVPSSKYSGAFKIHLDKNDPESEVVWEFLISELDVDAAQATWNAEPIEFADEDYVREEFDIGADEDVPLSIEVEDDGSYTLYSDDDLVEIKIKDNKVTSISYQGLIVEIGELGSLHVGNMEAESKSGISASDKDDEEEDLEVSDH